LLLLVSINILGHQFVCCAFIFCDAYNQMTAARVRKCRDVFEELSLSLVVLAVDVALELNEKAFSHRVRNQRTKVFFIDLIEFLLVEHSVVPLPFTDQTP